MIAAGALDMAAKIKEPSLRGSDPGQSAVKQSAQRH